MPTVSSGSQITTFGIIFGWKMIFLVWVFSSVSTPARPTSEPVPAVVGTATIGAMPSASARVHQSPMSSKSQTGRVWPAMKATSFASVEAAAAAEGDDAVMAAGTEGGDAGGEVGLHRVGLDVGEQGRLRPPCRAARPCG